MELLMKSLGGETNLKKSKPVCAGRFNVTEAVEVNLFLRDDTLNLKKI